MKDLKVIELFAGVGGFRIGLNRVNEEIGNEFYKTIWSNQYEPATKIQHASRTYVARFGSEGHVNKDIALVPASEIPEHDMLVGGFPCQDYSVARTLSQAAGIEGKKGVLWWEIYRILHDKEKKKAKYLFLENVDRLVQSPAKQRGRDFALMLQSLSDLGYYVEWRIVNAAEYGMPQRRRRTYILAYRKDTKIAQSIKDPTEWLFTQGVFANAFPIKDYTLEHPLHSNTLKTTPKSDLADLSNEFNKSNKTKPFENAGVMIDGEYWTFKTEPNYHGDYTTLGDIIVKGKDRQYITDDFYVSDKDLPQWQYLKGAKHEERKGKDGFTFFYNEGGMAFPDSLDKPSRTIITSEGGKTPSRFKHVILDPETKRYRRLVPIELERLDMFPDNHTVGENDTKRAFFMGNALVCGIITKVGEELYNRIK